MLISVGGLPPSWRPSGAGLGSRPEGLVPPRNAGQDYAIAGRRLFCGGELSQVLPLPSGPTRPSVSLVRPRPLWGAGPHAGRQFPGERDHDLLSVLAPRAQGAGAVAEAPRGLPPASRERRGHLL